METTVATVQTIARRARLASAAREPLELHLSPEESKVLADALDLALEDDQAWFWSEAWQAGERAAEDDLAAGRFADFETMEEFLADLGLDPDRVRQA